MSFPTSQEGSCSLSDSNDRPQVRLLITSLAVSRVKAGNNAVEKKSVRTLQNVPEQGGELVEIDRSLTDDEHSYIRRRHADTVADDAGRRGSVERRMNLAAAHKQRAGLRGEEDALTETRIL